MNKIKLIQQIYPLSDFSSYEREKYQTVVAT